MAVIENLLFFFASAIVLVVAGDLLVRTLSKIASFLHVSEFVIGFVLMAFSTTLPELFVGISSALAKNPALSLGTVIGSNMVNLTLIGGILILLAKEVKTRSKATSRSSLWMFLLAFLPVALFFLGRQLSRIDGAFLLFVYLFYLWRFIRHRKKYTKELKNRISRWGLVLSVFLFIISLVILYISASFVVKYATGLAIDIFLPPIFIGLFIIALGTSLPELTFAVQSAMKKHAELSLGDLIGANIANATLILGVTALICPIKADFFLFMTSAIFMLVASFLFFTFVRSGRSLDWREGIALIFLYILFLITELSLKGIIPAGIMGG